MRFFVIVLFIFLPLFILLFFAPIKIKTSYWRVDKKDKFIINFNFMWGLIKFNFSEPDMVLKNRILAPIFKIKGNMGNVDREKTIKESKTFKFKITELIKVNQQVNKMVLSNDQAIRYLLGSIKVSDFIWTTNYGLTNPAYTGMVYGLFWSIKSIIFNFLQGKVKEVVNKPKFDIKPNFFKQEFSTHISCIFTLNLGHIIIAGLKILVGSIYKRG